MAFLKAKVRNPKERAESLRKKGILPAVLYGSGIKNILLEVGEKDFLKAYEEAGESSIVKLEFEDEDRKSRAVDVLIHQTARDPLKGKFVHVDFFHPSLQSKIELEIPIVFKGEAPACGELGGTLMREIQQVKVRGLISKLPKEIVVNVDSLKTFDEKIHIKDLPVLSEIEILHEPEDIVVHVVPSAVEEPEVITGVPEVQGEAVPPDVERKEEQE